jgi:hypothetical protein
MNLKVRVQSYNMYKIETVFIADRKKKLNKIKITCYTFLSNVWNIGIRVVLKYI